jgi:hypothetical protein
LTEHDLESRWAERKAKRLTTWLIQARELEVIRANRDGLVNRWAAADIGDRRAGGDARCSPEVLLDNPDDR